MTMQETMETYLKILNESLIKKINILNHIYEITEQQNSSFHNEKEVIEVFERCMDAKDSLLKEMKMLDDGFDRIYESLKDYLKNNASVHRTEVMNLQNNIREITGLSIKIQNLEQSTKQKFQVFLNSRKNEIRQFKLNNRSVSNYYKQMTGSLQGESFFIDKQK